MSLLTIYHGSANIIKNPDFKIGKEYNDYGRGFYCTENVELAKEWACTEGVDGYANKYQIETDKLKILNLCDDCYTTLNWLALLLDNRIIKLSSPVSQKGREYLISNFLPEISNFDAIIGYRADDSYFSFARSFVSNEISLRQLEYALKLGKLGLQFVLKSEKAFKSIKFVDYTVADNSIYYLKRKARDEEARVSYYKELENEDINGIYMRDIIRDEYKNNDSRLQ